MNDVVLLGRFPFGRYAATPWYRSRREHVGNVEWPPSPWRIARALVASAYALGGAELAEQAAGLVRKLATDDPTYRLPHAVETVYAQWMPTLEFDDSPGGSQRSENGHTLLALDPETPLVVRWQLELSPEDHVLFAELAENIRYLGQSVAVCELELVSESPSLSDGYRDAVPRPPGDPVPNRCKLVTVFAPKSDVTLDQLGLSTRPGSVRAMPVPPGARRLDYILHMSRRRAKPPSRHLAGVVHRLDGDLRPPLTAPLPPRVRHRSTLRPPPPLESLLRRATGLDLQGATVRASDDDGDGRAERVTVLLPTPRPAFAVRGLLDPPRRLVGPAIDCALRLERAIWQGDELTPEEASVMENELLTFTVDSARPPLLADAIIVAEAFRRRLLGVAGRRFGSDTVPERLSGRTAAGERLERSHRHVHFLCVSSDGRTVDLLGIWCPGGLSSGERGAIEETTLPALNGRGIRLHVTSDGRLRGPATVWRSHTPFLPVRHRKRRDRTFSEWLTTQIRAELASRDLPDPFEVRMLGGPWDAFRIVRAAKAGCFPELGAHGFELRFAEPVQSPIALGRNSHFGMGLFLPTDR